MSYLKPKFFDEWQPLEWHPNSNSNYNNGSNTLEYSKTSDDNLCECRLDVRGKQNRGMIVMATTSIDMLIQWGVKNIEKHIRSLTESLVNKLTENIGKFVKFIPLNYRSGHVLSIGFRYQSVDKSQAAEVDVAEVCRVLGRRGVVTSHAGKLLRVSPYIYNTMAQINKLVT